ncbi:hypothetical protein SAMN05880561_11412 [Rhizobium sp. RU33A]|uniref:hypothetical protein n=1 Tax=Rhizobium sp. RU33A TaxID=1907413 RepID=UPI000955A4C8|nr:hypothetical protein [Rhizobium sp. RU33A]SIR15335.1 hypothetical protein SAMN05880561_11412 [Rhizobium sp. RU33A]
MHVYKEKSLQQAATTWMKRHWDYRELTSDEEAIGDRMDSIGWLKDELIAIEVKPVVHGGMVYHREDRGSSLEAKVACTLADLYTGVRGRQLDVIREHWSQLAPLSIGILAGSYSAQGLESLKSMLTSRAEEWHFNYRIIEWTGSEAIERATYDQARPPADLAWNDVAVPKLVGRSKRSTKTLEQVHAEAFKLGVNELFDACIGEAESAGFKVQPRPTGLKMTKARPDGTRGLLALFLDRSDPQNGINLGIDAAGFALAPGELPERQAPRAGFLNSNRYLRTSSEIAELFEALAR